MSAATIQETIASAGQSQTLFVGPNSKLMGALISIGATGTAVAKVQIFFLGTWIDLTSTVNTANTLFDFSSVGAFDGNLPAGSQVRVDCSGTFTNATIILATS